MRHPGLILESVLRRPLLVGVLCCGTYGYALGAEPSRSSLPLEVIADAPLTGKTIRWDYGSVDGSKHRLYLAHLGDSVVTSLGTFVSRANHGVARLREGDSPPYHLRWRVS